MIETTSNWDNGLLLHSPTFPKTPAEYQLLIDANDPSGLDNLLMEHLEKAPQDIAFYLPAYRAFIRKQEINRASALLDLQVGSLRERHDLTTEISLLLAVLGFWPDCTYAREQLLGHLNAMYPDSLNGVLYTRYFKVLDNSSGVAAFRRLEQWLRYDEGRVVYVPSKGVARIKEANPKIGVVRLSLKNSEQMTLRIDEAERLALPLRNDHFLARTIIDLDTLKQLSGTDPGELLRLLFASIQREVTLNELREMLRAVVPDDQWNCWWAFARKDPRMIAGSGLKPKLEWNDSVAEGSAGLMATFMQVSPGEQLAMLKKHAARSEALSVEMVQVLANEAKVALASNPSLALEIVLTVAIAAQSNDISLPCTAEDLLEGTCADAVIAGIRDRCIRRKAMQIVAHSREDWPPLYGALLKTETDTATLKLLYESLHNGGHHDILGPVVEDSFLHPSGTPQLYLWLCNEIPKRPELQHYANRDFLHSLCGLLDDVSFKGHRSVLRKLFDPGHAVDRAIETLDALNSRSLLDTLLRARELEDYVKDSIRQKFFTLFPELHETKSEM